MDPADLIDPADSNECVEPEALPAPRVNPEAAQSEHSAMDRRRFIRVLAVGGAAVLTGSASGAPAAAPKAVAPKPRKPIPPNVQKELRTQESNLADVLRVIRAYDLPSGSEPATVFRALRARRGVR